MSGHTKSRSEAALGASLVILSSFVYAGYGMWTKLIGDYFGAFTQAVIRCVVTTLLFIAIAFAIRKFQRIHWRRDARWLLLSLVSSAVIPATLYYGILNAGIGVSLTITYLGIMVGMFFFGWLFAGERLTRSKWLSIAFGTLGLGLIFISNGQIGAWLAMVASLASGLASGLNVVASKKMPYNAIQTAIIAWTGGIVANLPFIFIIGEPLDVFGWDVEWLYISLFSVSSVIASWSLIHGVKLIEAGVAGVLGMLEIVFAILIGILMFGERPGPLVLLGAVAIIAAAAVPYLYPKPAKQRKTA